MRPPASGIGKADTLRIFIVAGEHSGDALGAKLMPPLRALHPGDRKSVV